MLEEWKDIKEYENIYQVSNLGNVKRLAGQVKSAFNSIQTIKERILKNNLFKEKYLRVDLSKNGKVIHCFVHRLVGEAFVNNPLNREFINHIDNNGLNNNASNLEWCNKKENYEHSRKQDRHTKILLNRSDISIPVLQLSLDEDTIFKEWPSAMEAQRNGFDSGHINKVARGLAKQHKGFLWKFKHEYYERIGA